MLLFSGDSTQPTCRAVMQYSIPRDEGNAKKGGGSGTGSAGADDFASDWICAQVSPLQQLKVLAYACPQVYIRQKAFKFHILVTYNKVSL